MSLPTAPEAAAAQNCPDFGPRTVVGSIGNDQIREVSGVAASRTQSGVLWVHNDSRDVDDDRVYAIAPGGATLMTVNLSDAHNWDWEDIAIGPGPKARVDYLYVADIGANSRKRGFVRIYRFEEPDVAGGTITVPAGQIETFTFVYQNPNGGGGATWSRNAESLAVDPLSGDVVVVEKEQSTIGGVPYASWVYRIRANELVENQMITARAMVAIRTRYQAGATPPTAADFSPDGRVLLVKNNTEIFAWPRTAGQSIFDALSRDRQTDCHWVGTGGESLAVAPNGKAIYAIPEGAGAEVAKVDLTLPKGGATCHGLLVTIKGTGGADHIVGTPRRDVINGKGGADTIDGRGGDDVICGGAGRDSVRGGAGADFVAGGPGADVVRGDGGRDTLVGNGGDDLLSGGPGYDRLNGGPGDDACRLGADGGAKKFC
jgi:Ca2+-binding RTX toxin-like protein